MMLSIRTHSAPGHQAWSPVADGAGHQDTETGMVGLEEAAAFPDLGGGSPLARLVLAGEVRLDAVLEPGLEGGADVAGLGRPLSAGEVADAVRVRIGAAGLGEVDLVHRGFLSLG